MKIIFNHNYPKLHNQKYAKLIEIGKYNRSYFTQNFIEYDTVYKTEKIECSNISPITTNYYYQLEHDKYLLLVFLGDQLIPFTTVRKYSEDKYAHYYPLIGCTFEIVIEVDKNESRD